MSRHYILDGYNVLHSDRRWSELSREAKRLQFLKYVEASRPAESKRNTVTVVLDGFAASLAKVRLKEVQLFFSGERDADTVIKEMVSQHKNPGDVVVITNDRAIRTAVKRAGADVMSSEEFFLLQKKNPAPPKTEKLDSRSAESINKELKRLWKLE